MTRNLADLRWVKVILAGEIRARFPNLGFCYQQFSFVILSGSLVRGYKHRELIRQMAVGATNHTTTFLCNNAAIASRILYQERAHRGRGRHLWKTGRPQLLCHPPDVLSRLGRTFWKRKDGLLRKPWYVEITIVIFNAAGKLAAGEPINRARFLKFQQF
jgi:hypothetical protein